MISYEKKCGTSSLLNKEGRYWTWSSVGGSGKTAHEGS